MCSLDNQLGVGRRCQKRALWETELELGDLRLRERKVFNDRISGCNARAKGMGWGWGMEAERVSHIQSQGCFGWGHVLRSLATLFVLIKMKLAHQDPRY